MSQGKVWPTNLRDIFLLYVKLPLLFPLSPYWPCQKLCCLIVFMSAVKKAIFMAFFSGFLFFVLLYNYGSISQIGVNLMTELLKYVLILFIVRILHWYFDQFDILCNLY
jgi:hypothetical protein